jgi:hypothetical protein
MIIVVKINRCMAAGGNVSACAYRAWRLTRLLNDVSFRNSCKYLVAMNGSTIEGIFCIKAIARDILHVGRVQFDLKPVGNNCFDSLEALIHEYNEKTNKLRYIQGAGYIYEEQLIAYGIDLPKLECCDNGTIPIVEASEIKQMERPNL